MSNMGTKRKVAGSAVVMNNNKSKKLESESASSDSDSSSSSSDSSSSDSSSSDSSDSEDELPVPKIAPLVTTTVNKPIDSSSDSSSSGDSSDSNADSSDSDSSDSSDSDSDSSESDSDEPVVKKTKVDIVTTDQKVVSDNSTDNANDVCQVYIKGLPWSATEWEIKDFFVATTKVELPLMGDGRTR